MIPARGGSKRIQLKNIRKFAGDPIILYAIRNAINSGVMHRIVVSTDNEDVAEVVARHGAAEVLWRPAELADDQTGTQAVMRHAIDALGKNGQPESACCLYATTPMLSPAYIRMGEQVLRNSGKPYALSVSRFMQSPQRALAMEEDGSIIETAPEMSEVNSQDISPRFFDAGGFYWGTAEAFRAGLPLYANAIGVEVPAWRAIDINTNEDWAFAEMVYRGLQTSEVEE